MSNNALSAIQAQGENTNKFPKKEDQKFTNSELLKKFFVPRVPKGQQSATFRARIIRNQDADSSPFKELKFHVYKVGDQWKKLVCLEQLGKDCPMCETHKGLIALDKKEDAKPFRAGDFYVVRVLDRAKEDEGVKFWRFKKNYKKNGEFDKILAKVNLGFDILSESAEGYDLHITCGLDDRGNSIVTDISCVKSSALTDSEEKSLKLINDDAVWTDVFRPQTEEQLEDVVHGRAQYWDDTLKKYVRPGEENQADQSNEQTNSNTLSKETVNDSAKTNPLLATEKITENAIISGDDEEEDLPF